MFMENGLILLNLAVFGAALFQSATGIGFGVIAGPILLWEMNSGAAVQVSIILNLLIACILAPSLRHDVDRSMLLRLLGGIFAGLPLGFYIFLTIDIVTLKILAGLAVTLAVGFMLLPPSRFANASRLGNPHLMSAPIGVLAGIMGGSLAMPGPVPAAWMAANGYDRKTVRATILVLFVFSYLSAFLLQFPLVGIEKSTMWTSATLAPATLCGIVAGRLLTAWITERVFRGLVTATLIATAALLFHSVL